MRLYTGKQFLLFKIPWKYKELVSPTNQQGCLTHNYRSKLIYKKYIYILIYKKDLN